MAWGLGNRQLYLVPQFFANKPVEHLLGPRITAEKLNDDRWGHTLDWLDVHDLKKLFAGVATHARQIFGIKAEQVHVDTTSFSVGGEYAGYRGRRCSGHRLHLQPWLGVLSGKRAVKLTGSFSPPD